MNEALLLAQEKGNEVMLGGGGVTNPNPNPSTGSHGGGTQSSLRRQTSMLSVASGMMVDGTPALRRMPIEYILNKNILRAYQLKDDREIDGKKVSVVREGI
jgi:hypothetical protein